MRNFRLDGAAMLLTAAMSVPAIAGADLSPLRDGALLTGTGVYPNKAPGDPLGFTRDQEATFKLSIDAQGNRTYSRNSPYWVYDRNFTRLVFRGVTLDPDARWPMLPPGGTVTPGMEWEVPVHRAATLCGPVEARYKARAEKGPELAIDLDGARASVPTIRIVHEAVLQCEARDPWISTTQVLFSPALHEILDLTTVNYDGPARDKLLMRDPGRGWRVHTVVTTASPK